MEAGGYRREKPSVLVPVVASGHPRRKNQEDAFARQELKSLIIDYKGFGVVTLIRLLLVKSCRGFILAIMGMMLLVGQWLGPIGFAAAKFVNSDFEWCDGGAGPWAQCVMSSVAMIYFARMSVAALSHKQRLPASFAQYNLPRWWPLYRYLDLVMTSLFYDTCIFVANLLIVFSDAAIVDMVIDVLALEFFTLIDDEFKKSVLEYDDSFLDEMLNKPRSSSPDRRHPAAVSRLAQRSSSWQPSPPTSELTETLFEVAQVDAESGSSRPCDKPAMLESQGFCCDAIVGTIKIPLLTIRLICRIGGPLAALLMIGYGPYCLSG